MTPERPSPVEQNPVPLHFTLEAVAEMAEEVLLRDGMHVPTLIAEGEQNAVVLQIPDIADSHEERVSQMGLAGFAIAHGAQIGSLRQLFFVSEGWLSEMPKDAPFSTPSQDPNRIEVL